MSRTQAKVICVIISAIFTLLVIGLGIKLVIERKYMASFIAFALSLYAIYQTIGMIRQH